MIIFHCIYRYSSLQLVFWSRLGNRRKPNRAFRLETLRTHLTLQSNEEHVVRTDLSFVQVGESLLKEILKTTHQHHHLNPVERRMEFSKALYIVTSWFTALGAVSAHGIF